MACENRLDNRKIGSAGRESMTYEVRIVDENDEPVPPGTPGEIVLRPKHSWALFTEYYKRPEDTVEAWRNLWFHTGDRGRMDEDGFLFFLDRMKDSIRRRGENISTWEIESTVNTHPAVLESAAYGVPSELSESDVMVAVVLEAGRERRARGAARLLPGQDGPLRDPALRPLHGRAAEEPRRAGPEVRAARRRRSRPTPGTARRTATRCSDERARSGSSGDVAVEMRDGVHLATDVYLPDGAGPFPTLVDRVRGGRSSAFIVGVLLLNPLDAVERGYAVVVQEVRGRAGSEASVASVRPRARGRRGLPRLGARAAVVRRPDRRRTAPPTPPRPRSTSPRSGRDEVKALAVLGTGADIHDGWVYTSGAFELGWNVYWAYMTATETITRLDVDDDTRAELQREYARVDHRGAGRRGAAADLRPPAARPRRRDAVPRVARASGLRRLLGVVRRARARRAACALRCSRSSGWHDNFLKSHFDLYRATRGPGAAPPRRAARGSTRATSRRSRRAAPGAVEFGPAAASGVALSTPLVLDWFDRWLTGGGHRRRRRRPLLAARRGRVARGRRAGRRRTSRSAGTSAPAAARTAVTATAFSRRGPAAGDEPRRLVSLRPARPGADRRRQDADADDHDRRHRGSGRGRGRGPTCSATPRRP